VSAGDKIQVDALSVEAGDTVEFDKVLMVCDKDNVMVGTPPLQDAKVIAESLGQEKGEKVLVFKYKRKTRYRRKVGHRQSLTALNIKEIVTSKSEKKKSKAKRRTKEDGT
jgi:large subunit ribosomal protein L21